MKRFALLAVLFLFGGSWRLGAQAGGAPMVSGRVFDDTTGCPLRGVALSAVGATAKTLTDANGRYYLRAVPTAPFTLQAGLAGYATQTVAGLLVGDSTARVDFSLPRDMRDAGAKPPVRYPSMQCVLDRKDSGGRYDRR
jgi:Carboxypeptidase regulatory-like domain